MFFSAKSKGFFVDSSVNAVLLARTSSSVAPFVVEEVLECPAGDPAALAEAIKAIQFTKSPTSYVHAVCGITAPRRVVRRITVEPKRLKEPVYLNELTSLQLRIEPDQYTLAALSPTRGTDYDMAKAAEKDMVICGLPNADRGALQEGILAAGIYPEMMELGSVASVGAMIDYLNFAGIKTPVLMLEVEAQSTNSYIVSAAGLEASRPIAQGLDSMIPFVQKELGLKDEAAARKLFLANAFDFTGMGSILIKKVIKELQSSIGFYEVQTGQSIGQVACTLLPSKLAWLEVAIAADLGVAVFKPDIPAWLSARSITLAGHLLPASQDIRRMGLLGLMVRNNLAPTSVSEKPINKSAVVATPSWHPDFRGADHLPDIKPIRTIFFINGAAVLIAVSLAIYVGYREVALRSLSQETATAETEVKNTSVASRRAVELFGKFKEQEKSIIGLQQFLASRNLVVSDFLLHLGAMMPPNIRLNSIDYKATGVVLRGDITGAAEEASGLAYTYLDVLRKDKDLSTRFETITLNSVVLDAGVGRIRFEFGLKFKNGAVKKAGGAK